MLMDDWIFLLLHVDMVTLRQPAQTAILCSVLPNLALQVGECELRCFYMYSQVHIRDFLPPWKRTSHMHLPHGKITRH